MASQTGVEEDIQLFRCKVCGWVFPEKDGSSRCPQCGNQGETADRWPDTVGQRLFQAVKESFGKGEHDLTVILACDLLEILLEMFFRDVFMKQGRPSSWIQWIFRKNKSLDIRLRYLFKETMGRRFASIIRGTPFEGFDKRWAMVRSTRSVLVHSGPSAAGEQTGRAALELSRQALVFFSWLNNRFCV
jgi:rubredoxin